MKKIYVFVLAIAASYAMAGLSACNIACKEGSGKMITENRTVNGFSKIDLSGSYTVVIKQDSVSSLSITADDNLMKYVKSYVNGDRLTIKTKGSICNSGKFVVNISLRDLSELKTSGTVDLTSSGKINAKDLMIDMSGASKVTLDLNANRVNSSGSGISELNLTGQASEHDIDFSGAGHVNALNFVVAKYKVESSGVIHCKINVLNELNIDSSGSADIEYRGNPATIHNDKSGTSNIKKIE